MVEFTSLDSKPVLRHSLPLHHMIFVPTQVTRRSGCPSIYLGLRQRQLFDCSSWLLLSYPAHFTLLTNFALWLSPCAVTGDCANAHAVLLCSKVTVNP